MLHNQHLNTFFNIFIKLTICFLFFYYVDISFTLNIPFRIREVRETWLNIFTLNFPCWYFSRSWSPSSSVQLAFTLSLKREISFSIFFSIWSRDQTMSKGGYGHILRMLVLQIWHPITFLIEMLSLFLLNKQIPSVLINRRNTYHNALQWSHL